MRKAMRRRASVSNRDKQCSIGQAVVELALVLPVLFLLTIGLIEIGLMIDAQLELSHAAWEGARAGATLQDPTSGDDEITGAVWSALTLVDPDSVEIDIDPSASEWPRSEPWPQPRGHQLTIHLRYPFPLMLPFAPIVSLEAQAVSRIEYQNP
jgi:hypothetical protein